MSTMPRVNRPGPRRRCTPCPACGEDAMRQYGAKHHGVVHRYFYGCQACGYTDVWREVEGGSPHWERLRTPLVPPRPEQCRLELPKPSAGKRQMLNSTFPESPDASADKKQAEIDAIYDRLYRAWLQRGEEGVAAALIPSETHKLPVIIKAFAAVSRQAQQTAQGV